MSLTRFKSRKKTTGFFTLISSISSSSFVPSLGGSNSVQPMGSPTVLKSFYHEGSLYIMHNKWPSSSYATPSCSTWGQRSYCLGVTHTKKGGGFRSNDNLADLISRIRNGYFRSFEDILVIDSKQNRELLDALISAGYIYNWEVYSGGSFGGPYGPLFNPQGHGNQVSASYGAPTKQLQVNLKYFNNIPAIRGIQQISKPGNRTYINVKRILKYSAEQNWGESKTLFLSTSEGILNHRQIISNKIGSSRCAKGTHSGEALCLIW